MDDVLTELRLLMETADSIGGTVRRSIEAQRRDTEALSQRIDDLNSELIAQSNRIQALTNAYSVGMPLREVPSADS